MMRTVLKWVVGVPIWLAAMVTFALIVEIGCSILESGSGGH